VLRTTLWSYLERSWFAWLTAAWLATRGKEYGAPLNAQICLAGAGMSACRRKKRQNLVTDVAQSVGADLVVVGNRGMTGVKRFVLGNVPNKISHHAPCSILIVDTSRAAVDQGR
jgi:hypothetical protein